MNDILLRVFAVVLSGVSPELREKTLYLLKKCLQNAQLCMMQTSGNSGRRLQQKSSQQI